MAAALHLEGWRSVHPIRSSGNRFGSKRRQSLAGHLLARSRSRVTLSSARADPTVNEQRHFPAAPRFSQFAGDSTGVFPW